MNTSQKDMVHSISSASFIDNDKRIDVKYVMADIIPLKLRIAETRAIMKLGKKVRNELLNEQRMIETYYLN